MVVRPDTVSVSADGAPAMRQICEAREPLSKTRLSRGAERMCHNSHYDKRVIKRALGDVTPAYAVMALTRAVNRETLREAARLWRMPF